MANRLIDQRDFRPSEAMPRSWIKRWADTFTAYPNVHSYAMK